MPHESLVFVIFVFLFASMLPGIDKNQSVNNDNNKYISNVNKFNAYNVNKFNTYNEDDKSNFRIIGNDRFTIAAANIKDYEGTHVLFETFISEVVYAQNGNIYLFIGGRYPNNSMSLVVFERNKLRFGNLNSFENKRVIVQGRVSNYRGKPQIVLENRSQILIK